MLIIPKSIEKKELIKLSQNLSDKYLFTIAKKAQDNLGITLKRKVRVSVVKIKSKFHKVALRVIFLVDRERCILILIRLKTDKMGNNMTFNNKKFSEEFLKKYEMALRDIENGDFRVVQF